MSQPKPIEFISRDGGDTFEARFVATPQPEQQCCSCAAISTDSTVWTFIVGRGEGTQVAAYCPDCADKVFIQQNRWNECKAAGAEGKRLDACAEKKEEDETNGPG